jgi:pantoate--beta-alanine ligase
MKILRTAKALRAWRDSLPRHSRLGFVPTMGALHDGHLSLINRSKRENPKTIVSIFVNPTQFGPKEDFKKYPRPWKKDLALLKKARVDALFMPSVSQIYSPSDNTRVVVSSVTDTLCGSPASRGPGHFIGVATVVAKLFNLVRPTHAYFGLKDYQQVRVIEELNNDLHFGINIVRCPTIREKSGLARSSRNAYLSSREKALAPALYRALQAGRKLLTSSPRMDPQIVRRRLIGLLLKSAPNATLDYLELVDPQTLKKTHSKSGPVLIAAAVKIGTTRLIDNMLVRRP